MNLWTNPPMLKSRAVLVLEPDVPFEYRPDEPCEWLTFCTQEELLACGDNELPDTPRHSHDLRRDVWEELGEPTVITVTVVVGDTTKLYSL